MKKFNKEELEFFLPDTFKNLSKDYILKCIFNNNIQKKWKPNEGDIIVGETGNIFTISTKLNIHESLGGTLYLFGANLCNRNGGNIADSTHSFTANESGIHYHPIKGEQPNPYHSSIRDFKFVPYPHELYLYI